PPDSISLNDALPISRSRGPFGSCLAYRPTSSRGTTPPAVRRRTPVTGGRDCYVVTSGSVARTGTCCCMRRCVRGDLRFGGLPRSAGSADTGDFGRVCGQWGDLDGHVRKQGESGQQGVQFVGGVDVEDGDVGVLTHDAPQVWPLSLTLQPLAVFLLARHDVGADVGVEVVGKVH